MARELYRYRFPSKIAIEDIESTFLLAIVGIESLHGEAQTRMDLSHTFDTTLRGCVIDASSLAGRNLARLFTGLLSREFGSDSFQVERIGAASPEPITA